MNCGSRSIPLRGRNVGRLIDAGHPADVSGSLVPVPENANEAGVGGGGGVGGIGTHGGEQSGRAGDQQTIAVNGCLDSGATECAEFGLHLGWIPVAVARED